MRGRIFTPPKILSAGTPDAPRLARAGANARCASLAERRAKPSSNGCAWGSRMGVRGVQTSTERVCVGFEDALSKRSYGEKNAAIWMKCKESAPAYGAPTKYHSVARTLCGVIFGVPAKYHSVARTLCGGKERARKGKVKAAQMSGFCNVRRAPRRGSVLGRT